MPKIRSDGPQLRHGASGGSLPKPGEASRRELVFECFRHLSKAQGALQEARGTLLALCGGEEAAGVALQPIVELALRTNGTNGTTGTNGINNNGHHGGGESAFEKEPVPDAAMAEQPQDTEGSSQASTTRRHCTSRVESLPGLEMSVEGTWRFGSVRESMPVLLDQFALERAGKKQPEGCRYSVFSTLPLQPVRFDPAAWMRQASSSVTPPKWRSRRIGRGNKLGVSKENSDEGKKDSVHSLFMMRTCWGQLPFPVMHPEAKNRIIWMCIGAAFIIYEACMLPYWMAFDVKPEGVFDQLNQIIIMYFLIDIPSQMIMGFRDSAGTLVMVPSRIVMRYMSTWFIPDFVASVPWEWVTSSASTSGYKVLFRVLRLFRMVRLLRLLKMEFLTDKVVMFIEANQFSMFVASVLRVVFMLFALTHWGACVWYVIGKRDGLDRTWLEELVTGAPELSASEGGEMYIWSVYFTLTTMTTVGFGDIVPTNMGELCFVLALLLCASLVFAGLMGTLTDLITSLNSRSHARSEQKSMLSRYMRWRAVPQRLTSEIRKHFLFMWETHDGYDTYEDAIKSKLPPMLKTELCYHIYGQILRTAPFLAWMRGYQGCLKRLAVHVQSVFLEKEDFLFRKGQTNEQIHILISGKVWLSQNERFDYMEPANEMALPQENPGYYIPRRKEAGLVDVGVVVIESAAVVAQHVVRRHNHDKSDMAAKFIRAITSTMDMKGQLSSVPVDDHGDILARAEMRLWNEDAREAAAARLIQSCWRNRRYQSEESGFVFCHSRGDSRKAGSCLEVLDNPTKMRSKIVKAPAYLGESCLWMPLERWPSETPRYMYTAQCQVRTEAACIPRSGVQEVIVAFSPWLERRLSRFQRAVHEAFAALPVRASRDG